MSNIAPFTATATVPGTRRVAKALARTGFWLTVAAASLLVLAWVALHWMILPHIERWRPTIERKTSETLGVPVRIGTIEASSSGWVATVELRDVVLLDPQGRPALQLARVTASASLRSMIASAGSLQLRLAQLRIDGAQLDLRRDATGRLFVAGLDFSGPSRDGSGDAADWFFHQREVAIRGATLRWTDELRGAPPLALAAVDLVAQNALGRHALRIDATPPPGWGDRFSLRGQFTHPLLGRAGDWQHWSGETYAETPRADARELGRYVQLPFELSQGVGALRAWVDWKDGKATAATLDLALREVALRLAPALEPLVLEQVQGRIAARRRADGGNLSLAGFGFRTGDGLQWPPGDAELAWHHGPDGALRDGQFSAGRLDLELVAHAGTRLPLGEPLRRLLAEARPAGIARDVKASWDGPVDAPAHYRVRTRVDGLALAAQPPAQRDGLGRPGLRNASIDLDASDQGGEATLAIKDGFVDLPGVFAEPTIPLDRFDARLRWRVEPRANAAPALQLTLGDVRLANADLAAGFNATWRSGPAAADGGPAPGTLELDGTLARAVAARTARYLPLAISEGARSYVQRAVLGGHVTHGSFKVRGALRDFPFAAVPGGEFRIDLQVDDLTFAYVPPADGTAGWPPMTQLAGELVIDRASLAFRKARAAIGGVALTTLNGGIDTLVGASVLTLDAQARGPVDAMLSFVDATPIAGWVGGALSDTTASGDGELTLSLSQPLQAPGQAALRGSLQLAGNDLRIRRELPLLAATRGRIDFTSKGFSVTGARARVLGGETAFDGGTQADGSLRFNAQGSVTVAALREALDGGPVAAVAGTLSGQTNYRLALGLGAGAPEIDLASDLVGIASTLPPPLAKTAAAALPLRVQSVPAPAASGPRDSLRIDLGSLLRAQFDRDLSGTTARVLRGGIGVNEAAPQPERGVSSAVSLPSLDVDAWRALADRVDAAARPAAGAGAPPAASAYLPTRISLKTPSLKLLGRSLTDLSATMAEVDGEWQTTLSADQVAGRIDYRAPGADGGPAGRIRARLARLALLPGDSEEATPALGRQPAQIPALDVVVDELELRGRPLGRMEVLATNRLMPQRQWDLTRFVLGVPEARLDASGHWAEAAGAAGQRSDFRFGLAITDAGALLRRLGAAEAIGGGKGRLEGEVSWLGPPMSLDPHSLGGQINIAIESGQFLQVQPGAARLLGVLSLQSLARRLTGDFRDLFQQGFVFDSISGDLSIVQGVATTSNLLIRGPQAVVGMEGSADIGRETQDLRVVVVPEMNAGAASLAVAAINPLAGLGTFVAQMLLREPLAAAGTREFHITGPWADPVVDTVARNGSGAAAPGASSPSR